MSGRRFHRRLRKLSSYQSPSLDEVPLEILERISNVSKHKRLGVLIRTVSRGWQEYRFIRLERNGTFTLEHKNPKGAFFSTPQHPRWSKGLWEHAQNQHWLERDDLVETLIPVHPLHATLERPNPGECPVEKQHTQPEGTLAAHRRLTADFSHPPGAGESVLAISLEGGHGSGMVPQIEPAITAGSPSFLARNEKHPVLKAA
jgi:hypothetical protein